MLTRPGSRDLIQIYRALEPFSLFNGLDPLAYTDPDCCSTETEDSSAVIRATASRYGNRHAAMAPDAYSFTQVVGHL